ncbi:MAG: hypothetical protein ACYSRR_00480 [Planctomycetota bacterium]|jgi:hypothetical protein
MNKLKTTNMRGTQMLSKILLLIATTAITITLTSCKKKTDTTAPVKTAQQYKAAAEKEITKSNMTAELEKLEKDIFAETAEE